MAAITNTLEATRNLGELVAERPGRARVLERFGIDYCCHGERPLDAACRETGVDTAAVLDALAAVTETDEPSADGLGTEDLATYIVNEHHTYLHDELEPLRALAAKVRDVHGSRHPELVDVARLVARAADELEPHLAREEDLIFPALHDGEQAPAAMRDEIRQLRDEHRALGELLTELRTITGHYEVPADGCASYNALYQRLHHLEHDTFRHIHLENNVLFPAVGAPA